MRITAQQSLFVLWFSVIGFNLNFAWEWFQCSPYFRHLNNSPSVSAMLGASLGDVALMVVAFLFISIFAGGLNWFAEDFGIGAIFKIVAVSFVLAVLVELIALRTGRWAYTEKNPIIPLLGVSALPIFQAILINPISFMVSKKITLALCKGETRTTEAL